MKKLKYNSGFTLIELAIVIVIVGILIGGLIVGRSMIGTSRIQGVMKQISVYDSAYSSFKSIYGQVPGDADVFASGGNNNGRLDSSTDIKAFWNHLSLGVDLKTPQQTNYSVIDNAIPISDSYCPMFNMDQQVTDRPCLVTVMQYYNSVARNYYSYYQPKNGLYGTGANYDPFKVSDAQALDIKFDDGLPTAGMIQSGSYGALTTESCYTGAYVSAVYNTSATTYACSVDFMIGALLGGTER